LSGEIAGKAPTDCQPMVALMIWIATMKGRVRNMVQQSVKPNCAPA
jgi:hypothetical protein